MKHWWKLALEEPYRVFFPLGLLASVWGVLMWPLWYGKWLHFYPGEAHLRVMIEGFLGAFVLGFTGTSFPRFTGNRPWFGGEFGALLLLWVLAVASHATGRVAAGDAAFSALLVVLFSGMASRWLIGNRDTPPPGFVLALAGILGGALAAGFLALSNNPAPLPYHWARLWLSQGFMLLPLMGIGPYLLPRLFGMASSHALDDSPQPPAGWWLRAVASTTAGLLIVTGFALEIGGMALAGQLLRAVVILAWFALETPVLHHVKRATTPGNAVRWGLHGLAAGCACAAIWPAARIGSLHLFFVSGLGLVTLAVGVRVVLGHAGRRDLLDSRIIWLRWVAGLLILAATTRMSADFSAKVQVSHHIYAAWTWALAALIWLAALAKYFFRHDDRSQPKGQCPRRQAGDSPSRSS